MELLDQGRPSTRWIHPEPTRVDPDPPAFTPNPPTANSVDPDPHVAGEAIAADVFAVGRRTWIRILWWDQGPLGSASVDPDPHGVAEAIDADASEDTPGHGSGSRCDARVENVLPATVRGSFLGVAL